MSLLNDLRSNSSSKCSGSKVALRSVITWTLVRSCSATPNRIDTSSDDRQFREASAMRLPESRRCVVPVRKVEICSGISIDFSRSCGRIRDFVSLGLLVTVSFGNFSRVKAGIPVPVKHLPDPTRGYGSTRRPLTSMV